MPDMNHAKNEMMMKKLYVRILPRTCGWGAQKPICPLLMRGAPGVPAGVSESLVAAWTLFLAFCFLLNSQDGGLDVPHPLAQTRSLIAPGDRPMVPVVNGAHTVRDVAAVGVGLEACPGGCIVLRRRALDEQSACRAQRGRGMRGEDDRDSASSRARRFGRCGQASAKQHRAAEKSTTQADRRSSEHFCTRDRRRD